MKRIMVVLMLCTELCAGQIQIPTDATIVCAGDSISAQYENPAPANHSYVTMLETLLRNGKAPHAKVVSAGVGGNTSTQLRNRFASDVLAWSPDLFIILVGINDIHQNVVNEVYKENLRVMVQQAKSQFPKSKILLVSPFLIAAKDAPLVSTTVTEAHRAMLPYFIRDMRKVATEFDCHFLNMHEVFEEKVGINGMAYYAMESVHPTDRGKLLLASRIEAMLKTPRR